jgi:hypothetical protein
MAWQECLWGLGFKVLWNAKGFALRPPHISTCPALSWFQSHGTSCLFHPNSTIDMNHHRRHDYNDDGNSFSSH